MGVFICAFATEKSTHEIFHVACLCFLRKEEVENNQFFFF